MSCCYCGSDKITTTWETDKLIVYNRTYKVKLPVRHCEACLQSFTDSEAEDILESFFKKLIDERNKIQQD